jgi:hypothetical protein
VPRWAPAKLDAGGFALDAGSSTAERLLSILDSTKVADDEGSSNPHEEDRQFAKQTGHRCVFLLLSFRLFPRRSRLGLGRQFDDEERFDQVHTGVIVKDEFPPVLRARGEFGIGYQKLPAVGQLDQKRAERLGRLHGPQLRSCLHIAHPGNVSR